MKEPYFVAEPHCDCELHQQAVVSKAVVASCPAHEAVSLRFRYVHDVGPFCCCWMKRTWRPTFPYPCPNRSRAPNGSFACPVCWYMMLPLWCCRCSLQPFRDAVEKKKYKSMMGRSILLFLGASDACFVPVRHWALITHLSRQRENKAFRVLAPNSLSITLWRGPTISRAPCSRR